MRTFKDNKGEEWSIVFTVGDALRLRREIGFDVQALIQKNDQQLQELLENENKILEILVQVLEPQIVRKNLVDESGGKLVLSEAFADRFSGDTLDEATEAFLYAVADSFPKLKRRALLGILDQLSPAMDSAMEAMEAKIQTMDLKAMVQEQIKQKFAES